MEEEQNLQNGAVFDKSVLRAMILQESRLALDMNDVVDAADMVDDLGFDSITMISLIVRIETTYGITVDNDDLTLDFMKTVDSLYQYVLKKIEAKGDIK